VRLPGAASGLPVAEIWLKLEHPQRGGRFKVRGIFNRILQRLHVGQLPQAGVLVALKGNTLDARFARFALFAPRPAPVRVQVAYL